MEKTIAVKLTDWKKSAPLLMAEHAAKICYQAEVPVIKEAEDEKTLAFVEKRLYSPGHHTTLQHSSFTFCVEGISVGDITFGMHLASPFYNSDQRSGRYCAKMFLEPDFGLIEKYVRDFWPEVKDRERKKVMAYIKKGVQTYHTNIGQATALAEKFLKAERPFISENSLAGNAPKIAQEQMRMFISVIFPTAFDFTVNATALAALWESAWTPAMRYVTDRMVQEVLQKFPTLKFMFDEKRRRKDGWAIRVPAANLVRAKYKPGLKVAEILGEKDFILPDMEIMHPLDKLHFMPEMMDNSFGEIRTEVEISAATMGQDQRHRTIRRSMPKFTGKFYVPPILRKMKLEDQAVDLMAEWVRISKNIPATLAMVIAPYGAMVSYKKSAPFNAILHEQAKRLCWCAQEEIYHVGRSTRLEIEKMKGKKSPLLHIFEPVCYSTGRCGEGDRFCGRDIKKRISGDYFPERKV